MINTLFNIKTMQLFGECIREKKYLKLFMYDIIRLLNPVNIDINSPIGVPMQAK